MSDRSQAVLIVDDAALAKAASQWLGAGVIAIDTEFMRTDTFYPILGLVQVGTDAGIWLVDPLAIADLSPLAAVLAAPAVVKVVHSCSEDLEVLKRALGQLPQPLFDTQVAAALCGLKFSMSYRDIVKTLVGVDLAKQETRSDWLRRPMSDAQLHYAADDVYYLQDIYQHLASVLKELGRDHWLAEDMGAKLTAISTDVRVDDYYIRIKGAAHLDRQGLAILQRLCSWREDEARQQDRPRGRILTDAELLEIAVQKPRRHAQLAAAVNLHPRTIRLHGQRVIDTVNQVFEDTENSYPPLLPAPLPRECSVLIKACQVRVAEIAGEVGVAQEVLARRSDVEHLVRTLREGNVSLPPLLATGWRRDVVGTPLLVFARSLESRSGPSVPNAG